MYQKTYHIHFVGIGGDHPTGIDLLVVVGRVGERNENGGKTDTGQLRYGGGPRPANHQIRLGILAIHVRKKSFDAGRYPGGGIGLPDAVEVIAAALVDQLQGSRFIDMGQHVDDRRVDAAGPLAAARDQDREGAMGCPLRHLAAYRDDLFPHRVAHQLDFSGREMGVAFAERGIDALRYARQKAIGDAGQ